MDFEIIDNLINETYQDTLDCILKSPNFPWYYNDNTNSLLNLGKGFTLTDMVKDVPQFVHVFNAQGKVQSDHFKLVEPIIYNLEKYTGKNYIDRIHRVKANLMWQNPNFCDNSHNIPHVDTYMTGSDVETLLYYVNDTDGDTFIFNKKIDSNEVKVFDNELKIQKRISPKKGRLILFDSTYLHTGSPPRKHKTRLVLNFVFFKEKTKK
jgi:hypothetical protein